MLFGEVFHALQNGKKIKLKSWKGYWVYEDGNIMMHCKNGEIINLLNTKDVMFTFENIASDKWEILPDDYHIETLQQLNFSDALYKLKSGKKVARKGWNGKDMYIYLVQPSRVAKQSLRNEAATACSSITTELIDICGHIDMKTADNSIVVGWSPSQTDMLAADWYEVE